MSNEIKKELIVHYNPKKHSEAYIEYTDLGDISAGLTIGLVFSAIGIFLVFFAGGCPIIAEY